MSRRTSMLLLAVLTACGPALGDDLPVEPSDSDDPITDTPDDTEVAQDTDVDPIPTASFDCATVPDEPLSSTILDAPRGYNDIVFDDDGAMIGHDGNVLIRATDANNAEVYAVAPGDLYKMAYMPDGDIIAVMASGNLTRYSPNGSRAVIASDLPGYGLAVGPDGMLYVSTNYDNNFAGIARVDPDTGETTPWLDGDDFPPRALEFSKDGTTLYFGTLSGGHVYKVNLDADSNPTGEPERFVTVPSGWHDTLELDACGNLYVGSFYTHSIFRVRSDLSVERILEWNFDNYGHGFEWGDANGGWNEQAIYITHPYIGSRVDEVVLGVPGKNWDGEVIGGFTL